MKIVLIENIFTGYCYQQKILGVFSSVKEAESFLETLKGSVNFEERSFEIIERAKS